MQANKAAGMNTDAIKSIDSMDDVDIASGDAEQFLTFIMAGEEYGVGILCVQEIRGWESATPLPNAPPHIKGVINLRGTIVPIIDLRQCFGMESIEYTPVTVVIVLKVNTEKGVRVMGIVVDAVSDVYTLAESEMRPAPDMSNGGNTEIIRGLVSVDKKMVILLDIDKLLTMEEIPNLQKISEQLDAVNS